MINSLLKILLVVGALSLAACEKQGPAEEAGEKIDNAFEDIQTESKDAADDAADEIENAIEDVADEVEDEI